ncbi:DUF4301 family protein [Cochleicola gelatinilyticus]|uniref:NAD metabolism ATPase/kinase n=1 Tax=Cochleicola gelatinilyticus TaxID=1763537 RepID=A0A167ITE5_9FLAO|nr:DUF4301 family protein [Cochleicola gelatinilyticus]OAB80000.1 NAD metabolism ATPase/kinase [Cochleicola gelatinilyticus]
MLFKKDVQQIIEHGLTVDKINDQIETFKNGIPYADVITAASINNGILQLTKQEQEDLVNLYETKRDALELVKFVPASGAATRMFKFLHQFLDTYDPEKGRLLDYIRKGNHTQVALFFKSIGDFAFVNMVRKKIRMHYPNYKNSKKGERAVMLAKMLLHEEGLNFSMLPKGLIPFHKYNKYYTTAFEEQLFEAAFYATANDEAYLHFTFSEKHVDFFREEFEEVKKRVSKKTKKRFNISYSFQKPETDTIAVTGNNKVFRDKDNQLIFRPSGHGALLKNLNEINADLVFIKNIDNVVAEDYVPVIAFHKKVLAGKLVTVQEKIFNYMHQLCEETVSKQTVNEVKSFLWNELNKKEIPDSILALKSVLNRPLRVCGVVKNTGAPGGGPFWIKDDQGNMSLQIVEMAQIDTQNNHQRSIANEATHFNPVDLVCGLRDYEGNKFDLQKFSDPNSGFISLKSQYGKPLKALELPGLWNGAMAHWNTIFIEVPLQTFNPVKTVNDLLQKEHRPNL